MYEPYPWYSSDSVFPFINGSLDFVSVTHSPLISQTPKHKSIIFAGINKEVTISDLVAFQVSEIEVEVEISLFENLFRETITKIEFVFVFFVLSE